MKTLYIRRHDTVKNLAADFGVSERTIRRDIDILSLTEPIYTQSGRYGGGVYVMEGHYAERPYLSDTESELLHKLCSVAQKQDRCFLTEDEMVLLMSITKNYARPSNYKF